VTAASDDDLPPPGAAEARRQAEQALRAEAIAGTRMATRLRLVTVPVIMAIVALSVAGGPVQWFIQACLAVFMATGALQYALIRSDAFRPWHGWAMVGFDMVLMAFTMFGTQAFFDNPWPPQILLRGHSVMLFFFVMAAVAFSLSPLLMLWAGVTAALSWSVGMLWLASLPSTIFGVPAGASEEQVLVLMSEPTFVSPEVWLRDVGLILLTGLVLAGVVWRSRRLVHHQIDVARERANLARHFSPTMVDEIAHHDGMLDEVRMQDVAVMFADVVGFTRMAEGLGPEATVALLRGLHRRIENAVFEHGGTLDKFLGDGAMATFGTPRATPRDAANALEAGRAALAAVDKWNAKRAARGARPVRLSIGLHYGEVVLGDVGSERRLEFAVIGDTVNVASRLEHETRELGARLVASDALVAAARAQGAETGDLQAAGEQAVRGREGHVAMWYLPLPVSP